MLRLAYSNIWISLSAVGFVLTTQRCLQLAPEALSAFLAFATMFMVYTFAKAIHFDPQADAVNDPERTAFLVRWRPWLIGSAVSLYLGALALAAQRHVLFLTVLPFVTALAYDLKWMPKHWRYRRLKDIPGVKSLVVAVTWAAVTVLFPVLLAGRAVDGPCLVLLAWMTVLWFVNTVYFDLGDMRGDELEGTRTLPLVLGFAGTRRLLLALSLVAALLLHLSPLSCGWVNLTSAYCFSYVLAARRQDQDLGFLCDVVADGMGVLAGGLSLLA